MKLTLRFTVAVMCFPALVAAAEGYCPLVVKVASPNGQRLEASITIIEQSGRQVNQLVERQDARFCDLGILPVTVKVGDDGTCNQVVVNQVPLSWGTTYHLMVTYDPMPCLTQDFPHAVQSCRYLFRISDASGKWMSGASLSVMPSGVALKSDEYGRAVVDTTRGAVTITVRASGYDDQAFTSSCSARQAAEPHEETIKLSRK